VGRSLWREEGSVVYSCCWPSPAQSFSGPSPVGLMTIFYSLRFETSLFFAPGFVQTASPYIASARTAQKTASTTVLLLWRDVTTVMDRCLLHHRLATVMFAEPFASKGCLCWLQNSGVQQTCHNTSVKFSYKYIVDKVSQEGTIELFDDLIKRECIRCVKQTEGVLNSSQK
jgi:hypothetical protein